MNHLNVLIEDPSRHLSLELWELVNELMVVDFSDREAAEGGFGLDYDLRPDHEHYKDSTYQSLWPYLEAVVLVVVDLVA